MKILLKLFMAFIIIVFYGNAMLSAQTNLQIKDLFVSETVAKDSGGSFSKVYISFLINRPDKVARIELKIGKNSDSGDVYIGIATIELRGNSWYCIFNEKATKLIGNKAIMYWFGDKVIYNDVQYVTIRLLANDGKVSDRAIGFVQHF